ncbi:hypothetical protein E2C01_059131 [Portunus trituberculatus]|uniref:Uncharacterized protein n=1 Tax=Portunus trituberculatus TaxID=210409 RepID=A0A5B7H7I6_PORTR|nr:hypothetical protein [Portunus trituberculatus]
MENKCIYLQNHNVQGGIGKVVMVESTRGCGSGGCCEVEAQAGESHKASVWVERRECKQAQCGMP